MKKILSKIRFFFLLFVSIYAISYFLLMIHYFISDFFYEKLITINKKHKLHKKEVEDILYLFTTTKVKIENHILFDILRQRDNLKNKKYYTKYSLLFIDSIDIIYDNNKAIWIFSSYE